MATALNQGLRRSLASDDRVMIMGEDVGRLGGVFRVTDKLQAEFGADRVIDTPLAESGIIGTAIGLAMRGYRPVCEIQFDGFIYPAFDQIVSQVAKIHSRTDGTVKVPLTIRVPYGGGIGAVEHHSESPEAYFAHTAGLRVVTCSSADDAYGMIQQAIRSDDPVLFFEPKRVYRAAKGEVPEGDYTVDLSKAAVVREGKHVTIIAWGAMLYEAIAAAEQAAGGAHGIDCEIIDLRTLWPVDIDTIVESVKKTGRVIVVHEAPKTCGFGAELIALINEKAFLHLEAPPKRVTGFDTPFPYTLEMEYLPLAHRILPAIVETASF